MMLALKLKLFTALVAINAVFCACPPKGDNLPKISGKKAGYEVRRIARMPKSVNESSGLAFASDSTFYTHDDSGGKAELLEVDLHGRHIGTVPIPTKNKDWEDLAEDGGDRIFIGDFGNNNNERKNLRIDVYSRQQADTLGSIWFNFPDQEEFPPAKRNRNFDCEGFFYHADSLYLFSKNWGKGPAKMYVLPASPGTYTARLADTQRVKGMVTGADISPSGQTFALLTYGRVYLFEANNGQIDMQNPISCISFPKGGQSEAILFIDDNDFIVSNEAGKLFWFHKKL
jgi:hypothetical protein